MYQTTTSRQRGAGLGFIKAGCGSRLSNGSYQDAPRVSKFDLGAHPAESREYDFF